MLISVDLNSVSVHCNNCNLINHYDLIDKTLKFIEEFQEYENLPLTCDNCGNIEVFNMNIPLVDEESEDFLNDEIIQRELIRELMKLIREDFVFENQNK